MNRMRIHSWIALIALVLTLVGCNRPKAQTDAQIARQVQSSLRSDTTISSPAIEVQAEQGIVTLSGEVTSDAERALAGIDAAKVTGVKTVVNNLVVKQAVVAPQPEPQEVAPVSQPHTKKKAEPRPTNTAKAVKHTSVEPQVNQNTAQAMPPASVPAPVSDPPKEQAPPPPPPPKKVTIPAGTQLTIRLNDPLDTEKNQVGDSFHGTLGAPIVMNDETVIPSGADVVGRVVDVKSAGRFAGNSALKLELNSLSVNGKTYNIQTSQWSREGKGEGKNTAIKTGGGAAVGAIIGGLAGGGKGAAIGSVAGAGAGAGASAVKKGEQIKLAPESSLSFLLINPLTVTQQSSNKRDADRTPLQ